MIKEKYTLLCLHDQIGGINTMVFIHPYKRDKRHCLYTNVRAYVRKNEFAENICHNPLIYAENNSYICRIK